MNERIKKLADRAGEYADFESDICTDEFLEKFAELLIQECVTIQDEPGVYSQHDMADAIKRNFGVK